MSTNRDSFEHLVRNSAIDIRRADLFDTAPRPIPNLDLDRLEGLFLGLAIGDALGNTSESMKPSDRHAQFGEIRDYQYNRHAHSAVGLPSDDTQMTYWAIESMLEEGGFNPEAVSLAFTREQIFGIGTNVRAFLARAKSGEGTWHSWGPKSAGNGALMRIAPALLPHLREPSADLWIDAALLGMLTHNDSASNASCVAFVGLLWDLLGMTNLPEPSWWTRRFVEIARELETHGRYEVRFGPHKGQRTSLCSFIEEVLPRTEGRNVLDACYDWGSGAFLLETVPSVLCILERHGHDPEEAVVRAVNDTRDNDTIAAIVGAAVGALHGRARLPERWVSGLLGRTRAADNGAVFRLIDEATDDFSPSMHGSVPASREAEPHRHGLRGLEEDARQYDHDESCKS